MEIHKPLLIDEIKKKRKHLKAPVKVKTSVVQSMALWITDHVGSMGFFFIIFIWTVSWLGWNIMAPNNLRFDPYPAFVLWLFISNMIQLFLLPLIMIGQNVQSKQSDERAEKDLKINMQAELEIETILQHLENQNTLILQILEHLDKKKS